MFVCSCDCSCFDVFVCSFVCMRGFVCSFGCFFCMVVSPECVCLFHYLHTLCVDLLMFVVADCLVGRLVCCFV